VISSGRCHGPGCTQTADGEFCGPACAEAWHAQFRWLHGDGPTRRPENERVCPRCGMDCVTDWVDVTEVGQPPGSEFVAGNLRCPQGHWDLQSETLQQHLEPFQQAMDAAVRDLAAAADMPAAVLDPDPDGPTSADVFRSHDLVAWRDPLVPTSRLRDEVGMSLADDARARAAAAAQQHVPTVDETHVWGAEEIAAAERLTRREHQPTLANAELLVSTNAGFSQVASKHPQVGPDPSRGWLARVLDRLFGRTT
jgi:hypothetical protein